VTDPLANTEQHFLLTLKVPANGGKIWTNEQRTILVRLWGNGALEIASRDSADDVWGPPFTLREDGRA